MWHHTPGADGGGGVICQVFRLFSAVYLVWAVAPLVKIVTSLLAFESETLLKACYLAMGLSSEAYITAHLITFSVLGVCAAAAVVAAAKLSALFAYSQIVPLLVSVP